MAHCMCCGGEMKEVDGCLNQPIGFPNGVSLMPVLCDDDRCGDCNAKRGHAHHVGCDMERCPNCHGQFLSCGCLQEGCGDE